MKASVRNASNDHVSIFEYLEWNACIVVVPRAHQAPSQRSILRKKREEKMRNEGKQPKENLHKQRRPRPMVFLTNLRPRSKNQEDVDKFGFELTRVYRLRFGIETDWSLLKRFRPMTRSKDPIIRLFFFLISAIRYNGWILARNQDKANVLTALDHDLLYQTPFEEYGAEFMGLFDRDTG
jgi:hypothetical protein